MPPVVLLVLLLAVPAAAAEGDAQQLYDRGQASFEVGHYDEAARLFEEAYLLSRRPRLLWNAALANRRQYEVDHDPERLRKARLFYQNCAQLVEDPAEKREAATEERAVAAEIEREEARRARLNAVRLGLRSEKPERPVKRPLPLNAKWWLWTIVGGAVVVGATTGLAVGLSPRAAPATDAGNFRVGF